MDGIVLNRLVELVDEAREPTIIGGRTYAPASYTEIKPALDPLAPVLSLTTLTSLIAYIESGPDPIPEGAFLHVQDPTTVHLVAPLDGDNRRAFLAVAQAIVPVITFKTWKPTEDFLIDLQTNFMDGEDRKRAFGIVGNLSDEAASKTGDDGMTQTVVVKRGVTRLGEESVDNPFELVPFRTFPEVFSPASPFILRVRSARMVEASLWPCDGGAWRLEAIQRVKKWLDDQLVESPKNVAVYG